MVQKQNEELDLTEIIGIIFKRFWLIAGLIVCGVVAALLANNFMRPMYEGTVL